MLNISVRVEMLVAECSELLTCFFRISQKHHSVLLKEKWVLDISISCSKGSLHYNDLVSFPDFKDWHAGNR